MGSDHSHRQLRAEAEDFLQPLWRNGTIDQSIYNTGKLLLKLLEGRQEKQLQDYFIQKNIQTTTPPLPTSVCLRIANKEEVFFECRTCEYMQGRCFCGDCFVKELHAGHDYQAVEGRRAACECGNDQIMDEACFCKRHAKAVTVLTEEDAHLKKEVRFLLELLLFLKRAITSKALIFPPQTIETYGELLFQYLLKLSKSTRSQQVAVSEALLQKMSLLSSAKVKMQSGQSLLEDLAIAFSEKCGITELLIELINQLFWTGNISKELLRIQYKVMMLGEGWQALPNVLQKLKFDPALCFRNQYAYFKDRSNARVFLNRGIPPEVFELQYSTFYTALGKLLRFKTPQDMVANLLEETAFSRLFNYQPEGTKWAEEVAKLAYPSFLLAKQLIGTLQTHHKNILKAIAINAFQAILAKPKHSLDLIFERGFTLSIFQYFDFTIPTGDALREILGDGASRAGELMLRFWEERQGASYISTVVKRKGGNGCPAVTLLATDHLYIAILNALLTSNDHVALLYSAFIERTQSNSLPLKEKLESLGSFIGFLSSLHFNFPQVIVSGSQGRREDVESTLTYLLVLFEGCTAAEFKANAQRFVSQAQVIAFIKEKALLEGKKIRSRGETRTAITLSPFSEYFPDGLPEITTERMIANSWEKGEISSLLLNEESLRPMLLLLDSYLTHFEKSPAAESQVQNELSVLLQSILAFSGQKRTKGLLSLLQRIRKRMSSCALGVQAVLRRALEGHEREGVAGESDRNSKKRQKLLEMKAKQRNVLEALQVGEEARGAECIVCRNSKPGSPSLLAHFGYKNVLARVVAAQTPFLEFSSCGHYIHEDCLQESHKNDFKIWYPCILCKAISNILLPSVPHAAHEQPPAEELLARVLTFLKNLGGIYTFLYQDRKQLVEFSLENVEAVFPLLFKTLAYQLTFYPILNLQYFQRSQLPVTRFLFDLLRFTATRLKAVALTPPLPLPLTGDAQFTRLFTYVAEQLLAALREQGSRGSAGDLPMEVVVTVEEILYMLRCGDEKMEVVEREVKEWRERVVGSFARPPGDLLELQQRSRLCGSCGRAVDNHESCVLCEWACCAKCSEVKKVHALEAHLSEAVFLRSANGRYVYVHEELTADFPSLYADYLGEHYDRTERAAAGEYLLSRERWEGVLEDLLTNRIHREIMKFN